MEYKAILFDTRSIQRYIYSGNRLRTNIGASYLVKHVFTDIVIPKLEEKLGRGSVDMDSWGKKPDMDFLAVAGHCAVIYCGGGKLLLVVSFAENGDEECRKLIRGISTELLTACPGLHIGAAFDTVHPSQPDEFQKEIESVYGMSKKMQSRIFPEVNVPYPGLTMNCAVSGETANYYDAGHEVQIDGESRFYSQEIYIKARYAEKANNELKKQFSDIIGDYRFPFQFDELGQRSTENYIAVVHIDGNNMGTKFRNCKTQTEYRRMSEDINSKTVGCFGKLLDKIVREYESYQEFLTLKNKILPIRPLILGGDDVTFVCPAKLAVRFAKYFMELMADPASVPGITSDAAKVIDSCGGIGIFKTSYPFFRGYQLSEQLCDAAKVRMRGEEAVEGTSWLDFAILHGEQSPTLEQIRAQEYSGARGSMHFGPYQVGHEDGKLPKSHRFDIENLLDCVAQFHSGKCMANNKIKEMRSVLQHGEFEAVSFADQLRHQGQHVPKVKGWEVYEQEENSYWSGGRTPYVDAIEMMDFIPKGE